MATKIADIRFSNAFKQLQGKGFIPIKFHFRDSYSWGLESTTEPKITVELEMGRKRFKGNRLENLWGIDFLGKVQTAPTSEILPNIRKLMKENEATYHLFGFGQYQRGTTEKVKAVTKIKEWIEFCYQKGLVFTEDLEWLDIDFCKMQIGEKREFYSDKGTHLCTLIKNY